MGLGHLMNILLQAFKIKTVYSVHELMIINMLGSLVGDTVNVIKR
jgi:hypothetical protein